MNPLFTRLDLGYNPVQTLTRDTSHRPLTPQDIRTHRKLRTYIPQKQFYAGG